jgi:hypothetical protein
VVYKLVDGRQRHISRAFDIVRLTMVLLCEMHTSGLYAHETRAREMHAYEVRAHEVHAHEVHAQEVHAHEVHAREVHAQEVHAHEVHAHEGFCEDLARQTTVTHLSQLQLGLRIWVSVTVVAS